VWGLRSFLGVCVGAPVMLLANLFQESGLANGSSGIVRDVVFAPTFGSENANMFDLPLFVIIDFPSYTGPPFPHWSDHPKCVPIPVMSARVNNRGSSTRRQVPIVLARALTHWKAQGKSLEQVYAFLCTIRHVYGLDYVAISRAMSRYGLMLDDVQQDMFTRVSNSRKMTLVRAERKRLEKMSKKTDTWTQPLLKRFFKRFYKPRHRRKNKRSFTTTSADVSYDVLATIHECDTSRYTGDVLASAVGEHTMSQMMADTAWRRRMHMQNHKKTKYFEILASQPGRMRGRKRERSKTITATYAAYQFAAFARGFKKEDIRKSKADLRELLSRDPHYVTPDIAKNENPRNNPFSFKVKTLLDSFAADPFNEPNHIHKGKKKVELQIEYARRANVQRLSYTPPKKKPRV
jgi:hypothetical protein